MDLLSSILIPILSLAAAAERPDIVFLPADDLGLIELHREIRAEGATR